MGKGKGREGKEGGKREAEGKGRGPPMSELQKCVDANAVWKKCLVKQKSKIVGEEQPVCYIV